MMSITSKVPFRIPNLGCSRRLRMADRFLSAARRLEDDLDPLVQGWVQLFALMLFLGAACLGLLLPVPIVAQATTMIVSEGASRDRAPDVGKDPLQQTGRSGERAVMAPIVSLPPDLRLKFVLPEQALLLAGVDGNIAIQLTAPDLGEAVTVQAQVIEIGEHGPAQGLSQSQRTGVLSLGGASELPASVVAMFSGGTKGVQVTFATVSLLDFMMQPLLQAVNPPAVGRKGGAA